MSDRLQKIEISVCICSYKRPKMLQRLLQCLEDQDALTRNFEVIVVDNDNDRSAEQCVKAFTAHSSLSVTYLNQPVQNIALARNHAVHAANGAWLAMIDDDERPTSQWLLRLHEAAQRFDSNIVLGPVIAELPEDTASWIRRCGFFDLPRYPSGTIVPYMAVRTGNLFIRRKSALELAGPFDPRYGLTGGEDVMMLEQLRARGYHIVWCDEASVVESVPESRRSLGSILRRAYREAQNYARVYPKLGCSPAARLVRHLDTTARGSILLPVALLFAVLWRPFDYSRSIHWLSRAAMQLGKLSVIIGLRNRFYAKSPGNDGAPRRQD